MTAEGGEFRKALVVGALNRVPCAGRTRAYPLSSKPMQTRSEPGSNSPAVWFQWVSPSIADLLFLVIFFALTCGVLAPRLLWDAGIGWHIRNGQQMLLTHTITRLDSFSSIMTGHAWYAWEWLYDAVIAAIHGIMGLNGVVFFSALVIATTFTIVLRLALRRGASLPVATVLLLVSIGACSIHLLARPHLLSWLFAVVWFQIVDSAATSPDKRRRLYWLPTLMLIWVNVHGGFVFGLVLLGIYMLGGWIQYFASEQPDDRRRIGELHKGLGIVTVLSFLATFVNPYGYNLHQHIYGYLGDRFLMNHIDEFLSPNFHHVPQQCFALLLLITILALAVSYRKLSAPQLLVVLFAASSGMYASRNLPISSLLLVLIVAPLLSDTFAAAGERSGGAPWLSMSFASFHSFGNRMERMESSFRGHLWPVTGVIVCLWICLHNGMLGSNQLMDAHFDAGRFPVQAVEVIAYRGVNVPIFCPDIWGGYLIYQLYPKTKVVVVDDRHDLYGSEFFKNYLKVIQVQPGWDKVLDQEHVTRVLMPAQASLTVLLRQSPQWVVVHEDETAVLFRKGDDDAGR
jgi:hypothetical protein